MSTVTDTRSSPVSIAPMLSVRNGARAVEFYRAAFGATEAFRIEAPMAPW
jgi:PhnB protein